MKYIILQILHYIWIRKDNIYSIYQEVKKNKNIKLDGKVNIKEIIEYIKLIEKSGLIIDESEDEKIYLGAIDESTLKPNTSKNIVQYEQSSWSCVIYAWGRSIMYNSHLVFTQDEIEQVKKMAESDGKWLDGQGMTFRDGGDVWKKWLKENKGVDMVYDRVIYNSKEYIERKEKGYSNALGGAMTDTYITDFKSDGVINVKYNWNERKKYGHCWTEEIQFSYTDNYPASFPHNRYVNKKYNEFVNNGYFYSTAYFPFIDTPIKDIYANMGEYEKQYRTKYGKGTIYNDIEGALNKLDINREYFFFNLIGMERIKDTK